MKNKTERDNIKRAVLTSNILFSKCPNCGSSEVGYCFPTKEYDCATCEHVWKTQPEQAVKSKKRWPLTVFKAPFKPKFVVHKLEHKYRSEGYPLCGPNSGYVHNASRLWKDVTCKTCLERR